MNPSVADVQPYLSAYLAGGWRKDNLVLETISVAPLGLEATLRVQDYFPPDDGRFHLTVPIAFIWIAQLAIIYSCLERRLPKKPGEVYLRDFTITCRRPIIATELIRASLTCLAKRPMPHGTFYKGSFSFERGAFVGEASFVTPDGPPGIVPIG